MELREPASDGALTNLVAEVPDLPVDYLRFLAMHNGGEGFLGTESYVNLWAAEELNLFNFEYEVAINAPGLFLFGSNGGGEAYAFDFRETSKPVVSVPFIGMDLRYARRIALTFESFLTALSDVRPSEST